MSTHETSYRQITALPFPDVQRADIQAEPPLFAVVAIHDLFVDASYQRDLSERSMTLIRKIIAEWNWSRFKPPVVVRSAGKYMVIDGQHTAIAAATHGGIVELPVMVVEAETQADQARAFLGHNRDRIAITNNQMFFAALAAGDETAIDVKNACDRAGATVLRHAPGREYRVGEIIAITALVAIAKKRSAIRARRVIEICVKARLAPIPADMLKAVDEIINGDDYADEVLDEDLVSTILKLGPSAQRKAEELSIAKRMRQWKALAITLYQNTRKRRGRVAQD